MSGAIDSVTHYIRRSRAPLSAGTLVIIAVWIQLADTLSGDWRGKTFADQLASVTTSLQGLGIISILLLAIGITGTVTIKATSLILEPLVEFYLTRRRVPHYAPHWRWNRRLIEFLSTEQLLEYSGQLKPDRLQNFRALLLEDERLQIMARDLRFDLEENPSTPFIATDDEALVTRLELSQSENNYGTAIIPALIVLSISMALSWSYWIALATPVLLLLYASFVVQRGRTALLSFDWLLEGKGSSQRLREIRQYTRELLNTSGV